MPNFNKTIYLKYGDPNPRFFVIINMKDDKKEMPSSIEEYIKILTNNY